VITLYGFGTIFPAGIGHTKDLRVQWALEELGLPYRVHALDHTGGELDGPAFTALNPFRQAPVIDDDGLVVSESGAIVLHLARRAGRLIPDDEAGRTEVERWCFAAVGTVEPTLLALDFAGMFDEARRAPELHDALGGIATRWFEGLERRLAGRTWIAGDGFTVADLMLAGVLRGLRGTDRLAPHPTLAAYVARCFARPAWERALGMYAQRLGVDVASIR
jgi:glutathione S-transferase